MLKNKEKELQLFQALFEQSPLSTQILSPDGVTLKVNKAFQELWNISLDSMQGYNILEDEQLAQSGTLLYIQEGFSGKAQEIPSVEYHAQETFGEGKSRWIGAYIFPIKDEQGTIQQIVLQHHDITDTKKIQDKLHEEKERSENYLRTIYNSAYDAIFIHDLEGNILDVNDKMLEMYQISREEVPNYSIPEDYSSSENPLDKLPETWEKVLAGQPHFFEWIARRPHDGSLFDVEVHLKRTRLIGQEVVLATVRDIMNRKQMEKEQQALQQDIIKAQQHAIQELSVPIIPIMDQIIVMPLIGSIDSMRAKDIMRTMLAGITQYRAKIVILDITGVSVIDTGVANHLDKTIQAARLKGTRTIITGISDAVAETIIDLGIDWSNVETLRDLQTGLLVALDRLGFTIARNNDRI
ncbi:PAS domain S-box protein [Anaerolineales bacterium HSG24]|nr:PAS domain S-box protein [Anaerolineales bacterium HSG24]